MPSRFQDVTDEIDRVIAAIEIPAEATGLARTPYRAADTDEELKGGGTAAHRLHYHDDPAREELQESDQLMRVRYTWDLALVLVTDAWNRRQRPRAIADEALAITQAILTAYVPPENCEPVITGGFKPVSILGTNQVEVLLSLAVEVHEDMTP